MRVWTSSDLRIPLVILLLLTATTTDPAQRRQGKIQKPQTQKHQVLTASQVFDKVSPRVILLRTLDEKGAVLAQATGVIVSADGYVATNGHVVVNCSSVSASVYLADFGGRVEFNDLSLVYYDEELDLAILKMKARNLPYFDLSLPRTPRAGEKVYALGNPRGLENTISEGIVSGLRNISHQEYVQHSAAISSGSSGGALVTESGDLVGVNAFLLAESQNLNFAIPVQVIKQAFERARSQAVVLAFPKSKAPEVQTDSPYKALFEGDYVRAIALANKVLTQRKPTTEEYCVLGISYFELGKLGDAETYLKQTLLLETDDDKFKQTARYYLIRMYAQRLDSDANAQNRAALGSVVKGFLESGQRTLFTDDSDKVLRDKVKSALDSLQNISGEWLDQQGSLMPFLEHNQYHIVRKADGTYSVVLAGSSSNKNTADFTFLSNLSGDWSFFGNDGKFHGTFSSQLYSRSGTIATYVAQDARVELALSDDYSHLSGTATYSNIKGEGVFLNVFSQHHGPGTVSVTLVRKN